MKATIYYRKCDACGRGMNEGYLVAGGEYYCSDKCLHTQVTPEQWNELYDDGNSDENYYTEWTEGEAWDELYDAQGKELKR